MNNLHYIAIEGVDGCGKTMLVDKLCRELKYRGKNVIRLWGDIFASDPKCKKLIAQAEQESAIKKKIDYYNAAREFSIKCLHNEDRERFVVSDRNFITSLVYNNPKDRIEVMRAIMQPYKGDFKPWTIILGSCLEHKMCRCENVTSFFCDICGNYNFEKVSERYKNIQSIKDIAKENGIDLGDIETIEDAAKYSIYTMRTFIINKMMEKFYAR